MMYQLHQNQENAIATENRWGFLNSFFFAITVVTTIGYGHMSPNTVGGRIFCIIYALIGIPMTSILLGAIGDRFSRCFRDKLDHVKQDDHPERFSKNLRVALQACGFFLPGFFVLLVIPALIFGKVEGWTFFESFYYCFITLSTIGFGDFVIGQIEYNWIWLYKLSSLLWIIFGLAYVSMILNFISQGFRSNRISNVVHSIRRISAPPMSHKLKKIKLKHTQNNLKPSNFNANFTNERAISVSDCSTNETSIQTTPIIPSSFNVTPSTPGPDGREKLTPENLFTFRMPVIKVGEMQNMEPPCTPKRDESILANLTRFVKNYRKDIESDENRNHPMPNGTLIKSDADSGYSNTLLTIECKQNALNLTKMSPPLIQTVKYNVHGQCEVPVETVVEPKNVLNVDIVRPLVEPNNYNVNCKQLRQRFLQVLDSSNLPVSMV